MDFNIHSVREFMKIFNVKLNLTYFFKVKFNVKVK